MTELERALVRLGGDLAFPETPDVSTAVRDRLERAAPARRRLPSRRVLVVAFVALAVAAGAAMAVPAARTAILEFFGLRGATVARVDTLPQAPVSPSAAMLGLGSPVPVEDGFVLVKWPYLVVPEVLGPPDAAYYSSAVSDGKVSLVYEPGAGVPRSRYTGVGILVTEFRGDIEPGYVDKLANAGTAIERLTVGRHPAIWLEGGPHYVAFRTPDGGFGEDVARLAGNTLLVQRGRLLVRIEGELERDRAVEIARSLANP